MQPNASIPLTTLVGAAASVPAAQPAKIGPNALIQTVRALREQIRDAKITAILQQCNQESLLYEAPSEMVHERAFETLVGAVADQLGVESAYQILWRSGTLTADYLLEHRIPRPFQLLLRPLPPKPALALLLAAIRQHAWTFVGSGRFVYRVRQTPQLTVSTHIQPIEAVCGFYGGTFEHLFRTLVASQTRVGTTTSVTNREPTGQASCIYTIHFQG
jgi:divinyl protochlorophyllide a 8-vinyl-reductase